MAYWEADPEPALMHSLRSLSFSVDPGPDALELDLAPFPGGGEILVSLDPRTGLCTAEVFGFRTHAIRVGGGEPRHQMALNLAPGMLRWVTGIDAADLCNDSVALRDAIGARAHLEEYLAEAPSWKIRRMRLWEILMRSPRGYSTQPPAWVARALQLILAARGQVRISPLARDLGIGLRRLERGMRSHLGCGPKTFARVVRFHAARRALASGTSRCDVAAHAGFSDQAHLCRELRSFLEVRPLRSQGPSRTQAAPAPGRPTRPPRDGCARPTDPWS